MRSVQRRLNSTGRKRITRDRITIALAPPPFPGAVPSASAALDLSGLGLPSDARVAVEAYYRSSAMRFSCGTVGALRPPAQMELTDIDRGGAVRFRVLVIASDGSGRILASAEGLRPRADTSSDREPLLPLRETDLGSQLWRLDVDVRNGPVLLLNNRIAGLAGALRGSALLQGAILPHAFRMVLRALSAEGDEEGDDLWGDAWRRFLAELDLPAEPDDPHDEDSVEDWVESAVKAFCDAKDFAERVRAAGLREASDA